MNYALILIIGLLAWTGVYANSPRHRYTFDQNWQFRLCKDTSDVLVTLKSLGISDDPFASLSLPSLREPQGKLNSGQATKTKVTDDTEPEQAQVTASEVTTGTQSSFLSCDMSQEKWQSVQIPHDWSIELPFDAKIGGSAGYLPGGQGIYVKEFTLPNNFLSSKTIKHLHFDRRQKPLGEGLVRLRFDGVYHRATVWINGHRLGYHVYGYTGFGFDITPYLNPKGKNKVVVHVNREEQSRWYTGSGIYRHVWLDVTNPTHIRENSVFITTNDIGTVNIQADIDTATMDRGKTFKIVNTILDRNGKKVDRVSHRWSVDDHYLYTVVTQLRNSKGKIVDEIRTPLGFRTIRFDADKGFFLNGKSMKLKGMCLHQDCGSLGVAVPEEYWERRLKALKAIGCNAIRCSHNPPSPEFLNICDTLGLLVIDEAFDKWKSGYYAPFFDSCAKQDITDMVLRDRNHPSVIVWSIGNEVKESWANDDSGVKIATYLNDIVKSLDTSRPTMLACQQGFKDKVSDVPDLVGYNYLEPRMIQDHKRFPNRKMLVTEAFVYYSGLRENVVRDFVEENPWHFVEDNDFIAGSFVWAGVDYLGESSPWPAKGWCSCPFDMTLKERPQAAFYHANWQTATAPVSGKAEKIVNSKSVNSKWEYLKLMVRDNCFDQAMGTDHWQYPPMADTWDLPYTDSRCVQIRCYTTCDSVQFFFPMWSNPQLPLKPRVTKDYPDHCITVQLPARKGKVLAVGYKNGQPVIRDSLINHGDVADVRFTFEGDSILSAQPKDMTDASFLSNVTAGCCTNIRLTLVDKDGLIQQMQPRKFNVKTEGPIRLLGVETGDMRRQGSWRTTDLTTYFGDGFIRLQSTSQQGKGHVIINVEGFDKPFIKEIVVK